MRALLLILLFASGMGSSLAHAGPDEQTSCGGSCQVICLGGCDSGHHYEWREGLCHKSAYSDAVGPYCDDGYVCLAGPCGRPHERVCNVAGTGCSSCRAGYSYESDRVFCGVTSASPGQHPSWMTTHYAKLANKPLNRIAIPGTHDSGTYLMRGFARCQRKNIPEQLHGGIRYFDLRVGILDGTGQVIRHGIDYVGPKISIVLDHVAAFLAHYPELVILKFSHFKHATVWKSYTGEDFDELSRMIDTKLAGYLVDQQTYAPDARFGTILPPNRTKGRAVIAMNGVPEYGSRRLLNGEPRYWYSRISSSYAATDSRTVMREKLVRAVERHDLELNCVSYGDCWSGGECKACAAGARPQPALRVLNLEPKPSSTYPEWLSRDVNPVTLGWVRDYWSSSSYNIIQVDYYDSSCLVPTVIWLNTDPDGLTDIPNCYTYPGATRYVPGRDTDAWDAKVWPY